MTESVAPAEGTVIAVRGAVVDVGFEAGRLPAINDELVVEWDRPSPLILEVQAHLDDRVVAASRSRRLGDPARPAPPPPPPAQNWMRANALIRC